MTFRLRPLLALLSALVPALPSFGADASPATTHAAPTPAPAATATAGDFFYGPSPSPDDQKKIEALLTPVSAILATKTGTYDGSPSGLVLLDEVIHYVAEDGRTLRIQQLAYRSLTDAGAKELNDDVFGYRHKQQTFRLVRAETIQPDGTVDPVVREAVLVQSPQRQADYALYDDQAEVRIIYPNVRTGSVTRSITVTEDCVARLPGAYTYSFIWGFGWPAARERLVVDLPPGLVPKLRTFTLGAGIPDPARETLPGGRVRLSWTRTDLPLRPQEVARAPLSQNGPLVRLTTLDSWDRIAAWFTGLVQGRDRPSPALTAQVATWTRGLTGRDAIIRALFTPVANEVRYTGLDLGDADYQPHACDEVWANRYGDCKDKAGLLVALLRLKDIPARVVLLNTDHLGLIDRRAPDYRVFTHAIVAVPDPQTPGGWRFYDPTLSWAEPGTLSPADADRDVLIIDGDRAVWARTPSQTAGAYTYDFDLKLAPSGELSGWLSMTAAGFYAAGQREHFRNLDPVERRNALTDTVRGFFSGAEVIDSSPPAPFVSGAPDTMKAYFIVPSQGASSDGALTLGFPRSSSLFLDLGTTKDRSSAYFLYQDDTIVSARIALPPGLAPRSLPAPYRFDTPTGLADSRWTLADGALSARLRLQLRQPVIPPSEFARFYQAMLSLHTWLDQPLALAASTASTPVPAAKPADELDLPLMPSGDGQLDLVDKLYPSDGDTTRRRAALLRTLQYFPNDKTTLFGATARLAWLDWNADLNQAALDRLEPLLRNYGRDVPPDLCAWAEITQALALRDLKRTPEAEAILLRIARDTRLSAERRSTAIYDVSQILHTHAPADAITLLLEGTALSSSWLPDLYTLLACFELQNHQSPDTLRAQLTALLHTQPDSAEDILKTIVNATSRWTDPADDTSPATLLQLITTLVPRPGPALKTALDTAQARQLTQLALAQIRTRLADALQTPPLAAWYGRPDPASLATPEQFKHARQLAADQKDPALCARLDVGALVTLPPGADFSDRLWRAAADADWQERLYPGEKPSPVLPLLLDLCDQLPRTDSNYYDGRFLRAASLARRKDYAAEHTLLSDLAADPLLPASFNSSTYGRLGASCEHLGDYPGALAAYTRLETTTPPDTITSDYLLRATLLHLHLDHPADALRLLALLQKTPEATLLKADGEYNIRELLALRATGHADTFWTASAGWWPLWQTLATRLHLPATGAETAIPLIIDANALAQTLAKNQRDNDPAAYLDNYRRLVSSARWLPSSALKLSDLLSRTIQMFPAHTAELRALTIATLEAPAPTPENLRLRQTELAAQYQDAGRTDDALATIAAFQSVPQPADATTRYLHRIWGYIARASRRQLPEASAALAADLADPADSDSLPYTIGLLADLYRAQHRTDDEAALLKRELANPLVTTDATSAADLQQRYEQLGGSARFARQVTAWLQARPIPWYDFAAPANLQDPRLRDLAQVLSAPDRQFNPAEIIKLNLLVAQDGNGSLDQQQTAFIDAFKGLLRFAPRRTGAIDLVTSVIDDLSFDTALRASILWTAIFDAYEHDDTPAYHRWRDLPVAAQLTEFNRKKLPAFTLYMDADKTSPAALSALADQFTARPEMSPLDVWLLQDIVNQLLRLGQIDAVRRIADTVPRWNLATDVTDSRESLQLDLLKRITQAEILAPIHEALLQQTLAYFPSLPAQPPAACADDRALANLPVFSPGTTRDLALTLLHRRSFYRGSLYFWRTFISALAASPQTRPLALDLIATALAKATDDASRAEVIDSFVNALDEDDPAVRQRLAALLAPYDSPADAPLTHDQISLVHIRETLRLGQPINLTEALSALRDPDLDYTRARLALRHYTQIRDLPSLKRTVASLSNTLLLKPGLLAETIPAFDLLGMKPEATLARGIARRELHQALLLAWAEGSASHIYRAIDLALLLGDSDPFPPGWADAALARSTSPLVQANIRTSAAWIKKDWPAAAREAAAALQAYPAFYHFNWYLGTADYHAGHADAARRALTIYTTYSKDEAEYPAALDLLKKLSAP